MNQFGKTFVDTCMPSFSGDKISRVLFSSQNKDDDFIRE